MIGNLLHTFKTPSPDTLVCFGNGTKNVFLGLLLALQVLLLIWFGMIVNVAYNVLVGKGADDSRSDDENDENEEDLIDEVEELDSAAVHFAAKQGLAQAHMHPMMQFQEEEVGVEGLSTVRTASVRRTSPVTRSKTRRSVAGRASGISIAGHSDHKELLGRIGCDKPS